MLSKYRSSVLKNGNEKLLYGREGAAYAGPFARLITVLTDTYRAQMDGAAGTANQFDNQPADMDHYVRTAEDHGGVHTNSGIPNRAFYLVASRLGGHAWERAGRIWYETLRDPRLRPNSGFRSFARGTVRQAESIFGAPSVEAKTVTDAWREVKVL